MWPSLRLCALVVGALLCFAHVAAALQELQSLCAFYKVLGSYPVPE